MTFVLVVLVRNIKNVAGKVSRGEKVLLLEDLGPEMNGIGQKLEEMRASL